MTELSLRAYIDFIEDRLARDAAAEAVAQCRHVLSVYPKHIDTYRVLARATAAQQNYMDALDLFQRVLSADPGDFVAHIGMSECYKEDAALDQSIWHLERAFEQVPSNRDLQNELKKLYEQRDGRAPLKVQMTSGALARMYLKGKLYDQAIAELSKALEHDPERLDLQVLLAESLWNNHQEVAAGKVAAEVLKKLPFSIDANRILAQLWLKAGQSGEARPFLDRVKELDPYVAYRVERGENAPADSFKLTALEFTSEAHASQVGAADWVSEIKGIEKQKGVSGPLKGGENITDIFSTPSTAPAPSDQPEAPASSPTPPSPAAAPTQMGAPDWLRGALGTGKLQANASTQPDWLKDVLNDPAAAPAAPPSSVPQATDAAPDWLKDVVGSEPPATPAPPATPVASEGAPDWLKETLEPGTSSAPMPPAPAASSGPDWLKDVTGGEPPAQPAPPATAGGKSTPAWLADVLSEQTPTGVQQPVAGEERPAPAWLDDVLAGTPAAPPPEISPKVVSTDMLNKIITEGSDPLGMPSPGSGSLKKGSSPLDFDALGEVETWDGPLPPIPALESDTIGPPPPLSDSETAPPPPDDWLTQDTGLKREPKEEVKAEDSGELPGWLMSDAPIQPKKEPAADEESESSDALPDWLSGDTSDIPKPKAAAQEEKVEDSGEVPDWLKGGKEDIPKPKKAAKAEDKVEDSGELPDWLKGADAPAKAEPKAEEKVGTGELPDWLKSDEEGPSAEMDDLLAAALEDDKDDTGPLGEDEPETAEAELKEKSAPEATEPAPAAIKEDDAVAPPDEGTPDGGGEDVPDWLSSGDLDSDDAMKWLEEMAAKIDPNFKAEGSDAAPVAEAAPAAEEKKEEEEGEGNLEWLREPTESEEEKPAAVAEAQEEDKVPDWLKPEGEPAKASVAPTDPDTAEALAWLDEQVKEQGASPDKPLAEQLKEDRPPVAAMPKIPDPDAEAEAVADSDLPDWLKDAGAQEERAKAMDAPDSAPELADIPELPVEADELAWLNEALEAEEKSSDSGDLEELFAEAKKAEAALSDEEKSELPDWMKEDAPASKEEAKAEKEDEELPAWLKGDAEEEKKTEPAKAEKEPEPVAEVKVSDSDELPDWLKGGAEEEPVTAGGGLTAFLQAVEPAAAETPKDEPEPKKEEPEPAKTEAEPVKAEEPAKAASPPPPPSIPKPIPAGEAGETLKSAREQMSNGELQKALEIYESLVASGHGQDETISDLMEIVKTRAVVNPKVYRVIGDALIGKGEMQEAMEYYKKALDNF